MIALRSFLQAPLHKARRACAFVASLWSREYHDARIILEQRGDLRYLVVSARFQRNLARIGLLSFSIVSVLLLSLTSATIYQRTQRILLENSHREIYLALQSAGMNSGTDSGEYTQSDMLEMARVIHERDMQIRQYIGDWTERLAYKNDQLRGLVRNSGLSEKVISIIQSNQNVGGFGADIKQNPLLSSAFAKETSQNKELMVILEALPAKMPLDRYSITSEFGIRNHPITKKPTFHAGIDLTVQGNDDSVRAVKPGRVMFARYHGSLGNTVILRHERGVETLYGHLEKMMVTEGEEVGTDKVIGLVGNTGHSTGKHLHFEVLIGTHQVDPRKVIQTAQNVQQIEK